MNIIKEVIKHFFAEDNWFYKYKSLKKYNSKKIILIGTPVHGNLGDHAIAEEEKNFFRDFFNEYKLFEILMPTYNVYKNNIKKFVNKDDLIVISGGGWMGNLWLNNEKVIREIVETYSNNFVIIMPQTIFYTSDDEGEKECKITSDIFSKHNNLQIILREKKSFEFAKKNYKISGNSKILLYPDIVLYGSVSPLCSINKVDSDIINVCLRNDRETVISYKDKLISSLYRFGDVNEITTVVPYRISLKNRMSELMNSWSQFANAKLTITDRLHAMLFSVLNGTPCIAIDNKTGKVFGVLEWLKNTDMVIKATSYDDVLNNISKIKIRKFDYDRKKLSKEFENMALDIRKGILEK